MHRLTLVMCGLILGTGLVAAFAQPIDEAHKKLLGVWTATQAEREGKVADEVVGNRLSFTGNRFQIQSKEPSGWTRARSQPPSTSTIRKGP